MKIDGLLVATCGVPITIRGGLRIMFRIIEAELKINMFFDKLQ